MISAAESQQGNYYQYGGRGITVVTNGGDLKHS
jgi:hypothetical protein